MQGLQNLSSEEKAELRNLLELREAQLSAKDPVVFANHFLNFRPDPWQASFLRSKSQRIVLNCSRQSGKSTTTAILALWEAIYKPKSVIVIDSPSLRQSQELMMKFEDFLSMLRDVKTLETDTKLTKLFPNGSRVLALPGSEKTIRGISAVSLFIEDEASRVNDLLYRSIRPMLAVSNGRLVLMSTPWGTNGHYHMVWKDSQTPGSVWQPFEITADQCPRITKEFLEEERKQNSVFFDQEYYCKFLDDENSLFKQETIDAAIDPNIRPLCFNEDIF